MSRRAILPASILLILTVLSLNLSCITIKLKSSDSSIPVITPETMGNPDLDLPGTTTEIKVSSQDGTTYSKDGVTVAVPALALSQDSTITLKEASDHPDEYIIPKEGKALPTAIGISKIYDLGPNGIGFSKPVAISIPYYKQLLKSSYDKKNIVLAYFNGKDWVSAGGMVDTDKGTVTAKFTGFPGIEVTVGLVIATTVAVTALGIGLYQAYQYLGSSLMELPRGQPRILLCLGIRLLPTGRAKLV